MQITRKIMVLLMSGLMILSQPVFYTIHAEGEEVPEQEPIQQTEPEESLQIPEEPVVTAEPAEESGQPEEEPAEETEEPGGDEPAETEAPLETPEITEEPVSTDEPEETPDDTEEPENTPEPAEESEEPAVINADGNYWSLDIKFFDSEVDNGHTPLTEINWNGTVDHLNKLPTRTIRVQITYRNTGSDKAYAPGELTLTLPNLMAGQGSSGSTSSYSSNSSHMNWTVEIPANDSTHSGFDWTLENGKNADVFQFTNASEIEENLNFEGSITLTYTLDSMGEFADRAHRSESNYPMEELYVDSCTHTVDADLQAELKETADNTSLVESNEITFDFERVYDHPWTRQQYTLEKKASRVETLELLGDNASDYIWVKYDFVPNPRQITTVNNWGFYLVQSYQQALGTIPGLSTAYPMIGAFEAYITDTFPEECVVLDRNHQPMRVHSEQGDEGTTYRIEPYGRHPVLETGDGSFMAYVGYPRSIYNEENGNLHITNTADLIGKYGDRTQMEVLATGEVSLDLSDFEFEYQGDLFRVDKYVYMYSNSNYYHYGHSYTRSYLRDMRYQDILYDYSYNTATWYLRPTIRYPGFAYDLVIGDDLLYSTDLNGNVSRVPDEDYYFTNLHYYPNGIHNTSGAVIQSDQYDCELWVRRAGSGDTEYELADTFRNGLKTDWTFTEEDAVVAFKFVVHDCKEGFTPTSGDALRATTKFRRQDIPHEGFLHNFDYLEIWKEINGEMVLINEPGLDTYATDYTQQEIAAFDQDTYGHYLQRGTDKVHWQFYDVPKLEAYLTTRKQRLGTIAEESENKRFTGRFHISAGYGNRRMYYPEYHEDYLTDAHKAYLLHGFLFYDLLPEGMELLSTPEEIEASMELGYAEMGWWKDVFNPINQDSYSTIRDENMNEIRWQEFEDICRENINVTVERNWNGTNRTKITVDVDLSEHPFYITSHTDNTQTIWSSRLIGVEYRFAVPYSSLEDYGKSFINSVYAEPIPGDRVTLDGTYNDVLDLNENGSKTDRMTRSDASFTITYESASLQGLTKTVETDQTAFTTTEAIASMDSDYRYRLRIKTGNSKVTNLVIYDTCEGITYFPDESKKHASDGNPYWQGYIRGVDTSFAVKQGWTVNVYWTPEEDPGTLAEDESWQPYTAETDTTQIKAFAFEYLDKNGNPAVISANYTTQVDILMHSPLPEDGVNTRTEKAYNGSWARWNALDEQDHVIPFIEGIQSNITKVKMNEQIEVTVHKRWDKDYEELRPASVTVELQADGETVDSVVLSQDNDWSYTFTDLWKYNEDGTLIAYSVYEPDVPEGYVVSYTDEKGTTHISEEPQEGYLTAINTYQRKKLRGVKRWESDKPSNRPESITIHLYRNGEEIAQTETTAAKNWKYEFLVDIYDENGEEYEYEVVEDVPEGYRVNYDKDPDHPVTIRFDSRSRTDSNRYDFVRFYYRQNGTLYYTNAYGATFPSTVNLPTSEFWIYWHSGYSDNEYYGFKITSIDDYTGTYFASVSQATRLPNYTEQILGSDLPETKHNPYPNSEDILWKYTGPDLTINNEYLWISLSGQKKWLGDRQTDRPESITVELLQNGEVYQTKEVTAADDWKYTFDRLPRLDENEEEYIYTIREPEPPEGYKAAYTNGTDISDEPKKGYVDINNTYTRKVLRGEKTWTGDTADRRPESITIYLYQNGTKIAETTTDASKNWKYEFTVDIWDENGEEYTYTVEEVLPEGYYATYELGLSGPVTIKLNPSSRCESGYDYLRIYYELDGVIYATNNYTGSSFPSQINLPSSNLWFYWHADGSVNSYYGFKVDEIVPYKGSSYTYSYSSYLPSYAEQKLNGTLPETKHNPYPNSENILWKYSPVDFMIDNEYIVTSLNGQKTWVGDTEDKRPESIIVELLRDGEVYRTVEVTAEDDWKYSFEDLPVYNAEGELCVYTIREQPINSYRTTYSNGTETSEEPAEGYNDIENTYYEEIEITVTKTWDDVDNKDRIRPGEITVHLLADSEEVEVRTLSEENNWTTTFTHLPKQKDNKDIVYTITEDPITGYKTEISGDAEEGFLINNKHTPKKPPTPTPTPTPTPEPPAETPPVPTPTPKPPVIPGTGDHSNIGMWAGMALVSFAALCGILVIQRRKD